MDSPFFFGASSVTWAPAGMAFATRGPARGLLFYTGLRGQRLYVVEIEGRVARARGELLVGEWGRLRDVVEGPDGALYVLTSNGDGRGTLPPDGDKVLRVTLSLR